MERRILGWSVALGVSLALPASAVTVFEDGGTHVIDSDLGDNVGVFDDRDPPFGPTEVEVTSTGVVLDLSVHGSSIVDVNAGSVMGRLESFDDSNVSALDADIDTIDVGGRSIVAATNSDVQHSAFAVEDATLTFTGGRVGLGGSPDDIFANDDARVFVSGGTTDIEDLFTNDRAFISIDGASILDDLFANGDSRIRVLDADVSDAVFSNSAARIDLEGGSFGQVTANGTSNIFVTGGAHNGPLRSFTTGTITVRGSGFNFPDGPTGALTGSLTGMLADGTPLAVSFERDAGASIVLPEPSAGGGAVALGLLTLAARRQGLKASGRNQNASSSQIA